MPGAVGSLTRFPSDLITQDQIRRDFWTLYLPHTVIFMRVLGWLAGLLAGYPHERSRHLPGCLPTDGEKIGLEGCKKTQTTTTTTCVCLVSSLGGAILNCRRRGLLLLLSVDADEHGDFVRLARRLSVQGMTTTTTTTTWRCCYYRWVETLIYDVLLDHAVMCCCRLSTQDKTRLDFTAAIQMYGKKKKPSWMSQTRPELLVFRFLNMAVMWFSYVLILSPPTSLNIFLAHFFSMFLLR